VRNSVHVVQDYLNALPQWDSVPRVDSLIIDYLGAEDTELNRQMTRKALVAAVTRAMEPGCKFDYVLTLIGAQGLGKSFIWKRIGKGWTSDSISTVTGKDAMEQIQGAWIIELAELAALRKAELESVKQFITKQDDSFRPAYGREVEHYDRACIFVATTNEPDFIRDTTGGRRWWPIQVGVAPRKLSPFEDLTDSVVDQIWAEALVYYMLDEPLYLDNRMDQEARAVQQEHTAESPWAGIIRDYVNRLLPEGWADKSMQERQECFNPKESFISFEGTVPRERVCALEVWVEAMNGSPKAMGRLQANEINSVLRNLPGWEPFRGVKKFGPYGVQRGFFRVTNGVTKSD
jgi:predicted P-loop ATPase